MLVINECDDGEKQDFYISRSFIYHYFISQHGQETRTHLTCILWCLNHQVKGPHLGWLLYCQEIKWLGTHLSLMPGYVTSCSTTKGAGKPLSISEHPLPWAMVLELPLGYKPTETALKQSLHYLAWEVRWWQPFCSVLHGWKKIRFSFQESKLEEKKKKAWIMLVRALDSNLGNTDTPSISSPVWKQRDVDQHAQWAHGFLGLQDQECWEALNVTLSDQASSDIGREASWLLLGQVL